MSKENKIIKELKKRNDVLKNQYMQEQARNYHLNYVVDKYKSILDEITEQLKKIKPDLDFEPWAVYKVIGIKLFDLVQILEKVKEK